MTMGVGLLESVLEEDVFCADDLRKSLEHLRQQYRAQARILTAWKTRLRQEKRAATALTKQRDSHLKTFQSDLMVFESQLKKSRSEFQSVLRHKDTVIQAQHQIMCDLSVALATRGGQQDLQRILPGIKVELSRDTQTKSPLPSKSVSHSVKTDIDNCNDDDSAIMMEDAYDSMMVFSSVKSDVKVMRSISDALEIVSRATVKCPPQKTPFSRLQRSSVDDTVLTDPLQDLDPGTSNVYQSPLDSPSITPLASPTVGHRSDRDSPSSFLYDSDMTLSDGLSDNDDSQSPMPRRSLIGSYEKLNSLLTPEDSPDCIHVTYNRVMSNHRHVTKPKDVKYKRINKAKSRSLEELRGKLKFWDPLQNITMHIGQSEV